MGAAFPNLGPDEAPLGSSHVILPMTGRVGDRGPEPLVPIITSCSYGLCSVMGRKLSSDRLGDLPEVVWLNSNIAGLLPGLASHTQGGRARVQNSISSPVPPFGVLDLESIYLQDSLLSGPSQDDSLLACSPGLTLDDGWPSPEEPPGPAQKHRQRLPGAQGPEGGAHLHGSLPSVDSGSLSEDEDEVFYN